MGKEHFTRDIIFYEVQLQKGRWMLLIMLQMCIHAFLALMFSQVDADKYFDPLSFFLKKNGKGYYFLADWHIGTFI